jgi:hypothetical protein
MKLVMAGAVRADGVAPGVGGILNSTKDYLVTYDFGICSEL